MSYFHPHTYTHVAAKMNELTGFTISQSFWTSILVFQHLILSLRHTYVK